MPFSRPDTQPLPRYPSGETPYVPPAPVFRETLAAAARQENLVKALADRLTDNSYSTERDPRHNPLDVIRGTKYEQTYLDNFVGSRNEAETRAIMRRIDQEELDRETLGASGAAGVAASIGMGGLDPTILMPGGVLVKTGRAGWTVARGALSVGLAAGAQAGAQEGALYAAQETRTPAEVAVNVTAGTILGGLLGAGAGALLSRAERTSLETLVQQDRAAWAGSLGVQSRKPLPDGAEISRTEWSGGRDVVSGAPIPRNAKKTLTIGGDVAAEVNLLERGGGIYIQSIQTFPPFKRQGLATALMDDLRQEFPNAEITTSMQTEQGAAFFRAYDQGQLGRPLPPSAIATSAGAAASDTRELRLRAFGLNKLPFVPTLFERTPGKNLVRGPSTAVFASDFVSGRRAMADLAETALQFEEATRGVTPVRGGGPAISNIARRQGHAILVRQSDELRRLYGEYQFGGGTLSETAFKTEVDRAARSADKHPIPQVQQAAEFQRSLIEPWLERGKKAGVFGEDVDSYNVTGAESFWIRSPNKPKIIAERNRWLDEVMVPHLTTENAKKAAIRDRMTPLAGDFETVSDQLARLEARIASAEAKGERIGVRQAERGMEVRRTDRRAETLAVQEAGKQEELDAATVLQFLKTIDGLSDTQARQGVERLRARQSTLRTLQARAEEAVRNARANERRAAELRLQEVKNDIRRELLDEAYRLAEETHARLRAKIEEEVGAWEGKSAKEAQAALKARSEAEQLRIAQGEGDAGAAPRSRSADKAVARAVRRITQTWTEMSDAEIRTRANEITDRLIGGPDGRLPYDAPTGGARQGVPSGPKPRGSINARELMIDDMKLHEWLDTDPTRTLRAYVGSVIPDILIAERFGDVEMTPAFKAIREEAAAKIAAAGGDAKKAARIEKEAQEVAEALAGVRDRIRGVYGWSPNIATRRAGRVAAAVTRYNYLTMGGGFALSSLPDVAGTIFRYGMTQTLRGAWGPWLKYVSTGLPKDAAYAQARRQFRALGIAIETFTPARAHAWGDILQQYHPNSRVERMLEVGSDRFVLATGLAHWTDFAKTLHVMAAQDELLRATEKVAAGTASKKQITRLAENGIDPDLAARIWQEFSSAGGGNKVDGVRLANTEAWTSAKARDAFEGALGREADIGVITPGQEKPLWLSTPVGSALGQFKSFVAAANERVLLANLQQHDFAVVQGLVVSVALGMLAEAIYAHIVGRPTPANAQNWIKQGMSRAGVLGWFEEGNAISAKVTRGSVDIYRLIGADAPLSRYVSRDLIGSMLGPTVSQVENMATATGAAFAGDWTAKDTTRVRRLVAGQNLLYLRKLFDEIEAGVNGALGVEKSP